MPRNVQKKRGRASLFLPPFYEYRHSVKEDHKHEIFGVQVNQFVKDRIVFAAVGSSRVSIYESRDDGKIRLLRCFEDPDEDERFFTCAWSYDPETPSVGCYLAAAGVRGVIRVFRVGNGSSDSSFRALIGHSAAINEVVFHPKKPLLLLSAGKDYSVRLWNVQSCVCIVHFAEDSPRDEVISCDFNFFGTLIATGGMDHCIRLWDLTKPEVEGAIEGSFSCQKGDVFPCRSEFLPLFSTRDVHQNYIDCVRFFGELILSKTIDNYVVCWMVKYKEDENGNKNEGSVFVLHRFPTSDCKSWFIKFGLDRSCSHMALGTTNGQVRVWDLNSGNSPSEVKHCILKHEKSTKVVRQVSFSHDAKTLIYVCDDASIWRFDLLPK